MIASSRIPATSSGAISGSGFASAKMMGRGAMDATIAGVTTPLAERPTTTSAPAIASSRVRTGRSVANGALYSFIPFSRPARITPARSTMTRFSRRTPRRRQWRAVASADAPAPVKTTVASPMSRPEISSALRSAAPAMIAVPCWSSWKTGMRSVRRQRLLDLEALRRADVLQVDAAHGRLQELAEAHDLIRILGVDLDVEDVDPGELLEEDAPSPPSPAWPPWRPMFPSPSTAVPLETTATRFPRAVYWNAASASPVDLHARPRRPRASRPARDPAAWPPAWWARPRAFPDDLRRGTPARHFPFNDKSPSCWYLCAGSGLPQGNGLRRGVIVPDSTERRQLPTPPPTRG